MYLYFFLLLCDNYNGCIDMKECILLVPNNIKKEIIKLVRKDYYSYNIKFMSLEEFKKKYIFDYDRRTIYSLMKKYNIKYDTALVYLKNLYLPLLFLMHL